LSFKFQYPSSNKTYDFIDVPVPYRVCLCNIWQMTLRRSSITQKAGTK